MEYIFYGVGAHMKENIDKWRAEGITPLCFADIDRTKWGTEYEGIRILSLDMAQSKYPDAKIFCTQNENNLGPIFRYLTTMGVPSDKIANYKEGELYSNLYGELSNIYWSLQDDLSRKIFMSRLDISLSQNVATMFETMVSKDFLEWKKAKETYAEKRWGLKGLWELLEGNIPVQQNKIYVLLAQQPWNEYDWVVQRFFAAMTRLNINLEACVCPFEDVASGKEYLGVKCISDAEFRKCIDDNTRIVIGFPGWLFEIEKVLDIYGEYKDIMFPIADTAHPQYIEPEIFKMGEDEIFVDVGVLDLQNSIDFIDWTKGKFEKIYAFEPDKNLCKKIQGTIDSLPEEYRGKIELVSKALHSENCTIQFPAEYHGSGVYSCDYVDVEAVTLDSHLDGRRVSFVKMDVEGAEMDVLKGMRNTIVEHKPKLAVCVYHKYQDIFEISSFLKTLVPGYKFHLRHYNSNETECVLFAQV